MAMRLPMRRSSRTVRPSTACERRVDGAEEEYARDANALERLAEDAGFEGGDVGGDVGQFRHWFQSESRLRDAQGRPSVAAATTKDWRPYV